MDPIVRAVVRVGSLGACIVVAACTRPEWSSEADSAVVIPKLWDASELADWATPVAGLGVRPGFVDPAVYYATPVDDLRTYPVYHPDFEPAGYRESLLRAGPQPLIEPGKLRTREDWIEAGRIVFESLDTPVCRTDDPEVIAHFSSAQAIDAYRDATHDVISSDGVLLDYRWVVGTDGKLRIGLSSCFGCHSRLMPDGSVLAGAPSNFDISSSPATLRMLERLRLVPGGSAGDEAYAQFGVPWRADDVHAALRTDRAALEALDAETGAPPGTTFARFGGSPYYPTRMADLRGIRHRRWLDATATHRNRGPEDVARYCILVETADAGVFGPHRLLPADAKLPPRPSDAAVYALALYVYSLEVPPSPHTLDALARRGRQVFEEESCAKCHTPPAYTNNELVPVPGFEPPADAKERWGLAVSDRRVGTDPDLALRTRKGTGYYKIPSLRGLWYRGMYGHSGFVSSLEDWFDPARLEPDYVPTGWRGPGVEHRAVPGHEFGLDLDPADKRALIAFLRTL